MFLSYSGLSLSRSSYRMALSPAILGWAAQSPVLATCDILPFLCILEVFLWSFVSLPMLEVVVTVSWRPAGMSATLNYLLMHPDFQCFNFFFSVYACLDDPQ